MAGYSVGGHGFTGPREAAAADQTAASDWDETMREFDALTGSGSAGIDPAEATAIIQQAEGELTGDITFSVPSGTFRGQVSVQLSTGIAGAEIRYTTNGAQPNSGSTLYPGTALTFTSTTQLRAQAFVSGTATGAMGTAIYIAHSVTTTHDLPLLVMDAYGEGKPDREYQDVAAMIMEPQASTASLQQTPAIATRAAFHLRGQSSANFEKAPYRLELRDNLDDDADYPVLGMPAESDWVLRGPFPDKTLIRDAFAYSIGRDMGLEAPRFAFVEFYLNLDSQPMVAGDYQGVYMLVENIKRSSVRLDIEKLKNSQLTEPEISGGYILQINLMAAEPPTLQCTGDSATCWSDLEVMEPDELQPAQQAWITNYIQKFHDSLRSSNPADPQTGYPAYIDVDSFVNRVVHNELAREGDAYIRSTHFYKDRGSKLFAGPLWDYDLGYDAFTGFAGMPSASLIEGWQYEPMFGMAGGADWFVRLMADATFSAQVKARWQTLRQGIASDAQMIARMATLTAPLANAAQRNFQRWPILSTATVGGFGTQVTQTWEEQLQIMRNFLTRRAAWLDSTSGWGGGVLPTTSPPTTTTPPPTGTGACTAGYAITSQWDTGFQGEVTVTAGSSAITGWTVNWTFGGGQTITQSWNATLTSSGSSVTARNVSYNGALSAGASTNFGFIGTWSGANPVPTVACTAS
ncbi:MAG: spore coat protein CotH [Dactylosporangium sp.]|nr:spore coat protein CotH [Dactylosporangium sp.]